ncbi:MAG: hypothetical protein OEX02_21480, partial [Cyclobacteriaceae bacterium]|nr:hypothetical protein [Cyclobacteriaceae bacterium]
FTLFYPFHETPFKTGFAPGELLPYGTEYMGTKGRENHYTRLSGKNLTTTLNQSSFQSLNQF